MSTVLWLTEQARRLEAEKEVERLREERDQADVVWMDERERLREALADLVRAHDDTRFEGPASQHAAQQEALAKARTVLNPERGEAVRKSAENWKGPG